MVLYSHGASLFTAVGGGPDAGASSVGRGRDSETGLEAPRNLCVHQPQATRRHSCTPTVGSEGILLGSNLSLLGPEPCDLSRLAWACLTGFLEERAHGPRLWGGKRRGGQAPCSFLKPLPCSTPAGGEDASEGSGGGGGQ